MSQTPINNQVAALLAAAASTYGSSDANTGEGLSGDWPPEGDHDCYVLSVTSGLGKFKEKGGAETPCAEIRFEYQVIPDTSSPTYNPDAPPQIFKGERFLLLPETHTFALEGSKTRNRIGWERFKGHLSKMLKKQPQECVNPMADFAAVTDLINGPSRLGVRLRAQYRPADKPNQFYKTEFIIDRITG
jgi:hypothetical protein